MKFKSLQPSRNRTDYLGDHHPGTIFGACQIIGWGLAIPAVLMKGIYPQISTALITILAFLIIAGFVFLLFLTIVTSREAKL